MGCTLGRLLVVAVILCSWENFVQAQTPVVDAPGSSDASGADPSPGISDEPTPTSPPASSAPAPSPPPQPSPAANPAAKGEQTSKEDEGFYYLDGVGKPLDSTHRVLVPQFHVVESGDTLWDISDHYFGSAWEWPRVWSYNPTITSPHWIYPGDLVRLHPNNGEIAEQTVAGQAPAEKLDMLQPAPNTADFALRQLAFVDREALRRSAEIAGSVQEKIMLTEREIVYLSYNRNRPLRVGKRYAIYSEQQKVQHPVTKRRIGSYVRVIGELKVLSLHENKRARALILGAVDVIERGARVGPIRTTFQRVPPARNTRSVRGYITAILNHDHLIGQSEVVFLDLTVKDGLKKGNRLYVVRRGDAYSTVMGPGENTGQDDDRFPARAIAELLVVQPGKHQSVALVTSARKEAGVGDIVVMKKSK